MKVGIVSFAHLHAYTYADALLNMEDVELCAISDGNAARGREAAKRFRTRYYGDYHEMLQEDLDAVVVCTENSRHAEVVIAAAEAGKHVLCEKPIATTVEDAKQMIEVCERNNVILQIAFPVRFCAPIQRLKQMILDEDLGRIIAIKGTNRGQNPGGWFVDKNLSGGGAVMDHTVHVIDLMRWFMGSEVREVYAEVDTVFNDIPVDDCGILTLEFENGVFASHDPSWSRVKSYPTWGDVTLEVIGTKGVTKVDAFSQHVTLYSDLDNRVSEEFWGDSMDIELIRDFLSCIKEHRSPSITGTDGLKALEVALAAYQSAETNQPVKLTHR
ncbi:Gfo/Idh/MocA family protein [Alicyclobacillus sp. SO9]|uniref:Gfo/Idh/MocA family protein n=1 Tax=Alicyclobacillus sp. SO9 TaxID=2665646 RepID=UPI0018E7233F|nr:Gfo/Idh/MocA family oxidoreductase [Alicyclobacillus sp. SO9]QQE80559.1 Gfo/Idh/MocA family oxidoreductase [Alicyclobacillus sp. SO9]